jgi:hypothetical protein
VYYVQGGRTGEAVRFTDWLALFCVALDAVGTAAIMYLLLRKRN